MHRFRVVLGLIVSAAFVALLLRQVDRGELAQALRGTEPGWLLAALVPYFAGLWLRAVRWRVVLRPSLAISNGDAFALVLVGYAANNVLPVRAGEAVRAGMLQRHHGGSWSLGLGTIVVERVLDGLVLAALLAATVALAGGDGALRWLALLAGAGFAAATLLIVLLAARPAAGATWARRLLRPAPAALRAPLAGWLDGFIDGLTTLRGVSLWTRAIALTVASWALEGVSYWLVGLALGLDLDALLYTAVLGAANLALVAPSTAGGVGPFEFFAREGVAAHGVAASTATAYAIVLHAVLLGPVVLAGLAVLWRRHLGPGALLRAGEPASAAGSE